ncbi:hypothetical protein LSG23_20525 (plasmid) [Bacillus velezensis]|uniref:hypothetical protein n=1 Tax=Bacillus velezensis TaxID=492670 RepID=UPI000987EFB8|nr:hypothetical protein [Bacillus velezensis]AQS42497.1 hypothetical protein BVH55_00445 [Bacillus velezensis]WNR83205.1 hypothetical protein RP314_20805 [Bacillus velezensis]
MEETLDKKELKKQEKVKKRKDDLLSGRKERKRIRRNLIILIVSVALIIGLTIFQQIYLTLKGLPTH